MLRSLIASLRRFHADRSGAVAVIVAIVGVTLLLVGGAAIDFASAYYIKQGLQQDLDAAARTVGASSGLTEAAYVQAVKDYLKDNLTDRGVSKSGRRWVTYGQPTVVYNATTRLNSIVDQADVNTTFLRLIGRKQLTVTASVIMRQASSVQLVLAIDMSDSNFWFILDIRTAANELINQLFKSASTVRKPNIAVVPFAEYVNIGNQATYRANPPAWLDVLPTTTTPICPQVCTDPPAGCRVLSPDGVYVPCPRSCKPGTPCTVTQQFFNGCVSPRVIPDPKYDRSLWAEIDFKGDYTRRYTGNRKNCGGIPILELSPVKLDALNAISSLGKVGTFTHIPSGLIWAWNVLDRSAPLSPVADKPGTPVVNPVPNKYGLPVDPSQPTATGTPNNVVVLLSDGVNSAMPLQDVFATVGPRPAGSTTLPTLEDIDQLTKDICQKMRDQNIEIFTVYYTPNFPNPADALRGEEVMSSCATPLPPGANPINSHFFKATNAATLSAAFNRIASMVSDVRLIQ